MSETTPDLMRDKDFQNISRDFYKSFIFDLVDVLKLDMAGVKLHAEMLVGQIAELFEAAARDEKPLVAEPLEDMHDEVRKITRFAKAKSLSGDQLLFFGYGLCQGAYNLAIELKKHDYAENRNLAG